MPITPGVAHRAAIVYRQTPGNGTVTYLLDNRVVFIVGNVGVPLDRQGVPYAGTYPPLGDGEPLAGKIRSFSLAHGPFSLLDAFPFQYGCTPPDATAPGAWAVTGKSAPVPSGDEQSHSGTAGPARFGLLVNDLDAATNRRPVPGRARCIRPSS